MSIKGTTKELYIGKEEVNIITFVGNKVTLKYDDLKRIDFYFAKKTKQGCVIFIKRTNEEHKFDFQYKANDSILRAIDFIGEHASELPLNELEIDNDSASLLTAQKEYKKGLKCPKCKSHNIDLWSDEENLKISQRTALNLNPLHPLTVFNTKEVKKEKISASKLGLGFVTGGASLFFTGTKKKAHNEYYCRDCGHRWIAK